MKDSMQSTGTVNISRNLNVVGTLEGRSKSKSKNFLLLFL